MSLVGQTAAMAGDWSKAVLAAAEVFYVVDRPPLINAESVEGRRLDPVVGDVTFDNVVFAYPQRAEVKVLRGLTFSVPAGKTMALVGPSGCGKSTVVQLLERFYDVASGTVAIDGVSVRDLHLGSLRATIGLVSQEPVLFSDTLRANILFGKVTTGSRIRGDGIDRIEVDDARQPATFFLSSGTGESARG